MSRQHAVSMRCAMFFSLLFWALPAWPQDVPNCDVTNSADAPKRQIFACGDALMIEREPNAELRIVPRANTPAPRVIEVRGGAILIDVTPGAADTQIRTPHAIATVRGTIYVVDAGATQTSVFVVEGAVSVRRKNDASTITLRAGEGADISSDQPLTGQTWGAARVDALLARFGR